VKKGRRGGVGAAGVHVNLHGSARLLELIFVQSNMSGKLEILEAAARDFDLEAADDFVDLRRLTAVIDRLDAKRCRVVAVATNRGDHLLTGKSATSWVASECQMSKTAAANRLCVGEQLAGMPKVAQALSSGDIGFQAASVICHLQQRVVEAGGYIDEEMWIENARESSIKDLADVASSYLARGRPHRLQGQGRRGPSAPSAAYQRVRRHVSPGWLAGIDGGGGGQDRGRIAVQPAG